MAEKAVMKQAIIAVWRACGGYAERDPAVQSAFPSALPKYEGKEYNAGDAAD